MAVAANQLIQAMNPGRRIPAPVIGSEHLYQGTMCFWERSSGTDEGYCLDDPDAGANNFAGICIEEVDNSAGSSGDKTAELFTEGDFVLEGSGFTQADVGEKVYASDNFTLTKTSDNRTYIGTIVEYISATKVRVRIDTNL